MRTLLTAVLIGTLSVALIQAPAMAAPASAPSAPLGVVVLSVNGHTGLDTMYSGATVYDGDTFETPDAGMMRIRLGEQQIVLKENSGAQFHAIPNGFSANLNHGSVVVSSAEGQTFELLADGATIRPTSDQPASGQVTMITPKVLVLTGLKGSLKVTLGNESRTVEAGNSYRMEVASEDPGPQPRPPQGALAAARNHLLWFVIPAVAGVTAYLIYRAVKSPDKPKG